MLPSCCRFVKQQLSLVPAIARDGSVGWIVLFRGYIFLVLFTNHLCYWKPWKTTVVIKIRPPGRHLSMKRWGDTWPQGSSGLSLKLRLAALVPAAALPQKQTKKSFSPFDSISYSFFIGWFFFSSLLEFLSSSKWFLLVDVSRCLPCSPWLTFL